MPTAPMTELLLQKRLPQTVETRIHESARRSHPLTDEQKAGNRKKFKVRVRVEHVFAAMTMSFRGQRLQ